LEDKAMNNIKERIRIILSNLANVSEDLLALSDDIWLEIDHNDSEAVLKGAEFKVSYNDAIKKFSEAGAQLSQLVEGFTKVSGLPPEPPVQTQADRERRDRVIRDLDTRIPHSLEEDFKYKRPFGFKIDEKHYAGLTAWQHIYEAVCKYFAKVDQVKYKRIPDDPAFTSTRGNPYFSRQRGDLRDGREFVSGVFTEVNLSANQIRENIKRLLEFFSRPCSGFVVYFREDRDA
jgi:hypothetical protein